jgi:TolB-like protein
MVEGEDILGEAVNVAARLEALAPPGAVVVSGLVQEHVRGRLPVELEDLGERTRKNMTRPVRIYRVRQLSARPSPAADPAPPDRTSLVVLPFANLSDDPEQGYFSDGITEDIITDLARISGLFVIARNSAFSYRSRGIGPREVSRELGVRYVVEGSVRRAGARLRVTAQLIDGRTGAHLWAERYDRKMSNLFELQDELTRQIVTALSVRLTADERQLFDREEAGDVEAYEHYLRGLEQSQRFTRDANTEPRHELEQALVLDPGLVRARAMLSHVHLLDDVNGWSPGGAEALRLAHELALQAVARAEHDPLTHWNLGWTWLWQRRHELAIAEERRALALQPSYATAHAALGNILHYAGRSAEGIEPILMALRLDPHGEIWLHFLALAYFGAGDYAEAASALGRRLIRKPESDVSRVLLAACYGHLGRAGEAQAMWRSALDLNPSYSLERKRQMLPYKDPARFEPIVLGPRKAGLPR